MAGTKLGGRKAAATNKAKYGSDFYKMIGSSGGRSGNHKAKGFASNRTLARIAGSKGGKISRRGKATYARD